VTGRCDDPAGIVALLFAGQDADNLSRYFIVSVIAL
jgi:hypothetical protein